MASADDYPNKHNLLNVKFLEVMPTEPSPLSKKFKLARTTQHDAFNQQLHVALEQFYVRNAETSYDVFHYFIDDIKRVRDAQALALKSVEIAGLSDQSSYTRGLSAKLAAMLNPRLENQLAAALLKANETAKDDVDRRTVFEALKALKLSNPQLITLRNELAVQLEKQ